CQRGHGDYAGRDRDLVATDELAQAVAPRTPVRAHDSAVQVPLDVLGQLLHRGVAALRLAAQRLHHDGVEVPAQLAAQPLGRRAALCADLLEARLRQGAARAARL